MPKLSERIEANPGTMNGKPVILGTRIPVTLALSKLAAGKAADEILVDHPSLTHEDIRAALSFAASYVA